MANLAFYRERAAQCQRDADATSLANVRERHLASRDVWMDMADRHERTAEARATKVAVDVIV